MKKKIIGLFLAALLSLGFVGCAKNNGSEGGDGKKNENTVEPVKRIESGVLHFLDFEDYNPDFQLIRGTAGFGKVSQNSDITYVKSGKYSAKVQPIGLRGAESNFWIPLSSETGNYDFTDVSKVDKIQFYAYNTENENKKVQLGFGTTSSYFGIYEFTMKPGWNTLAYFPDLDDLNIAHDLSKVQGLVFRFDSANCYYLKDAPTYYFDDLKIYYDETKTLISDYPQDEGEIVGFEKSHQVNTITATGSMADYVPTLKVVTAAKEGLVAPEGNKILKVTFTGVGPDGGSARIRLPEKFVRASGILDIPKDELGGYRIAYESYGATANQDSNCMILHGKDDIGSYWYNSNDGFVGGVFYQKWTTNYLPLTIANRAFKSDPGSIEIVFYLWGNEEKVCYFDNFRIEKIS